MKYLNLCFLLLVLSTFFSCKSNDPGELIPLECDKLTSREEARNVMEEVKNDRFTDSEMIVENLIGEWGLIGILPGWSGFETGQECFKLTIDANMIELEDLNSGNKSATGWELKKIEVNGYIGFYLETNEDVWNNRIGMQIFSEGIMYGDGRVDDANIYIYEKLK